MDTTASSGELPALERIVVNAHCWLHRTDGTITIFVRSVPLIRFDADDIACSRLAMVQVVESGAATQQEVAEALGVKRVTIYRQRDKFRAKGVAGLVPDKRGPKGPRTLTGSKEKTVLKLKQARMTNAQIAQRLGVSASGIHRALKRLGYHPEAPVQPKLVEPAAKKATTGPAAERPSGAAVVAAEQATNGAPESSGAQAEGGTAVASLAEQQTGEGLVTGPMETSEVAPDAEPTAAAPGTTSPSSAPTEPSELPVVPAFDVNPANRALDRCFARLGLLQDAGPLFGKAQSVAGVGVLLAVPILAAHGVFADAMQVFQQLGAAFYGLRNTVLTLLVCFLRGINRPENLKQYSPAALGQVLGLDRAPEMKTLRRKIWDLAGQSKALEFIRRQAQRFLGRSRQERLWLYLDGHVSVYSGKRKLAKHHVTRLRIALPSVLEYWVNDEKGDPVLVVDGARPRRGLVAVIEEVIGELRGLGERRPITIVFDREGWSPALFAKLDAMKGVYFLTYRKAAAGRKLPRLSEKEFKRHQEVIDGQEVEYELAERKVYITYGRGRKKSRLKLRQVTCRKENGHQTHIVTNGWTFGVMEIARRMFGRWGCQENFFKYGRKEMDFDGLVTYLMEDDINDRLVPNRRRMKLVDRVKKLRAELDELRAEYGGLALSNEEASRRTMRGFKIANGKLGGEIRRRQEELERLEARLRSMPAKIPVAASKADQGCMRVNREVRQLMHAFRMAALRAETALRELMRSSYGRWREDGRTLVRTFLATSGDLEVTDEELVVTLDHQSAPHRTRLLADLCAELNRLRTKFPGSNLVLRFQVRGGDGSGSG